MWKKRKRRGNAFQTDVLEGMDHQGSPLASSLVQLTPSLAQMRSSVGSSSIQPSVGEYGGERLGRTTVNVSRVPTDGEGSKKEKRERRVWEAEERVQGGKEDFLKVD